MATIASPRTQSPANTPRIQSPSIADTATSSARTSLDLPPINTRSSLSAGPSAQQPTPIRRGNRAALREFYNLKTKPSQSPNGTSTISGPAGIGGGLGAGRLSRTTSITSTSSQLTTVTLTEDLDNTITNNASSSTVSDLTAPLDAPSFDPQPYVANILATSSLRDILRVEATLVSEIRNLDGERKALVYDNYSKLISAVGTIGEMQRSMNETPGGGLSEVGELEGKMEGLRVMVREITASKGEVERMDEQQRRKERRTAKEAEKKRELVRWVLGAPARLKGQMNDGREEDAGKEWAVVRGYLDKWQGVKGVENVRKACEEALARSETQDDDDKSSE